MTEAKNDNYPSNDDDLLDFNMRLRHDVALDLTTSSDGKRAIPKDNETLNTLRGFLKDNDSSVFTKRRLNVDEIDAENDARAADLLETMMSKATGIGKRDNQGEATGKGPDLGRANLPEFDITDDVTSAVGNEVDLDEITSVARSQLKGEDN